MGIKYKVIDTRTGDDITHDRFWVITPDGQLLYDDYDLIRYSNAEAILIPDNTVEQSIFNPPNPVKMRKVTNPFG